MKDLFVDYYVDEIIKRIKQVEHSKLFTKIVKMVLQQLSTTMKQPIRGVAVVLYLNIATNKYKNFSRLIDRYFIINTYIILI